MQGVSRGLLAGLLLAVIEIVVVAVPADAAQGVVDRVIGSGVRAILNFAPVRLRVPDGIALRKDSPALLLIQRIRDEAHRFAVTFHRQSRTKRDLRSEIDEIGGVGPRRRKALLTAFGSVAGVRRATREDLVRVVGAKCADAVLAHFSAHR